MYVHGRSEWCISRQRAWGVPIPVVYSSAADGTGREVPYLSPSNIDHIVRVLEAQGEGTDYWWIGEADEFVEPGELERSRREGRVWRKGMDTMDVWFDSGCSWTLLREEGVRAAPAGEGEGEARRPLADVYFEGSDQHRGWFQSSLLTKVSSAEAGQEPLAPYRDVVTHGMVLDDKGRKMSKSLGNIVSPSVVIQGGKVRYILLSRGIRSQRLTGFETGQEARAGVRHRPPARVGRLGRLDARRPHRSGHPRSDVRGPAQDPQYGALPARQPG